MSRHRTIRDAIAARITAWKNAGDNPPAPNARVLATFRFEDLQNSVTSTDNEVFGVIVVTLDDIDDEAGSRRCDADVISIAVYHFKILPDSDEATANAADDITEALRDDLRKLQTIPLNDARDREADRIRTTLPTPFDYRKLQSSSTWAAMLICEYSVVIPDDIISDEPPI